MDDALREGMGVAGLGVGAFHAWTSMRARRAEREDAEQRQRKRERLVLLSHMIQVSTACTEVAQHLARRLVFTHGGDGRGRACWKQRRAQNNFYELFSERTTDDVFKRLLRMNKESFRVFLGLVRRDLEPAANARGDFMSPQRTLTLTLMRLAHGTSYLKLSESFAIAISTAHKCYMRGIAAICRIQSQFIRMPTTCAEIEACIRSFSRRGFPNACLAVDGCHVKVELADQTLGLQDFICYKGFYSLNNIAYVDGNGMFKAVLCGWAGSSADGGVIKEMEFTKLLQVSAMDSCQARVMNVWSLTLSAFRSVCCLSWNAGWFAVAVSVVVQGFGVLGQYGAPCSIACPTASACRFCVWVGDVADDPT